MPLAAIVITPLLLLRHIDILLRHYTLRQVSIFIYIYSFTHSRFVISHFHLRHTFQYAIFTL